MISERLKSLRTKHSMSQKDLAKLLETSQQTVAKWENGDMSPKPENLKKLTEIFEVSSDYLLGIPTKISENEIISALFGDTDNVTADMYKDVKRYAKFLLEQKQNNN